MPSPLTRQVYLEHIDGLRAVAVLAVVVYHLEGRWLPGGFLGVDVFFVISGFVVTGSLRAHRDERLGAFLSGFYARRLARIVPALLAMLVVICGLTVMLVPKAWLSELVERTGRYAFVGLSNWLLATKEDAYFAPRAGFNPFTHTWSLGVEEQFYLAYPLLFALGLGAADARRRRACLALLAALAAGSFAFRVGAGRYDSLQAFYSIFARFWELATGALLSLVSAELPARSTRLLRDARRVTTWVGVLLLGVVFWNRAQAWPWAVGAVVGTTFLLSASAPEPTDFVRRALGTRWLVWVGQRSYSLYLWHWPIFALLRWTVGMDSWATKALGTGLSFGIAAASFRVLESPIRRRAHASRLASAKIVAAFVAAVGVAWFVADNEFRWLPRVSWSASTRNQADWQPAQRFASEAASERRCEVTLHERALAGGEVIDYLPERCGGAPLAARLFVLGDSHATAYLAMFDQLSAELGVRVSVYYAAGCPFLDLLAPMGSDRPASCVEFPRAALADIVATHAPGVVFLPSLRLRRFTDEWESYSESAIVESMQGPEGRRSRQGAMDDAPQWIEPFRAAAMTVVFEAPKPIFHSPVFRCVDVHTRSNSVCERGLNESRSFQEGYRRPVMTSLSVLTEGDPKRRVWDPFPILCPSEVCSPLREGRPLFFDGDHVSQYGNVVLYPHFRDAMKPLLASPDGGP